ncbi:cysteine desulfurase family protein [Bacillus haynesii]|uniref:cysteine desulfurase family protein n=1 Tax=Bacillus haynesii TaxID=1925021 RepID=UPI00227EDAD0|nr:aminotransferase class V-fold PLP-dependent enzyme [Bacillus haynesii]MCY8101188.1 aminotransferase class V-fold PLP-dependent enzyme [Bacillus haynesii]MCY8470756.1 aminotransferase class V-fold PLP-dependent enzyme [Bacillus haynesii]
MLYLDNSATTKVNKEVLEAMLPYLKEEFGNPSSKYYTLAENAKKAVETARQQVATLLRCESDEVIFTSGATESNNMILKGVTDYYTSAKSNHVITTTVEHSSVRETCRYLESKGFHVTYLDVDKYGRINIDNLEQRIKETPPILVSIIWGNNEIGSLNDMKSISEVCSKHGVFLHTDATQVVGKINVDLTQYHGINFLSCSGHKLQGPKGIGISFIRKHPDGYRTKLTPLLHGGGQEFDYRSGTLAVHNIVGIGKAAELAEKYQIEKAEYLTELENYLIDILYNKLDGNITINNDNKDKIPGILSIQLHGINNELFIKKVANVMAVSTGSACSSTKPSHVLSAIGLGIDRIRSTIRISLSADIQKEDLDIFKTL